MRKISKKVFFLLDKKDKKKLIRILLFSILISFLEAMGVGIIMPFVSVSSDFELIHTNNYYNGVYNFFTFTSDISFVVVFGLSLVFFYLFRSFISLLYYHSLSRFSQGRYYYFANKLFDKYLNLFYFDFLKKNSSLMVKSIVNEAQNLSLLISNILFLVSEVIVAMVIYLLLLYVNWKITLIISLFLGLNIFFLLKTISPKIKKAGLERDVYQKNFYELLGSVFGNFKILKLHSSHREVREEFQGYTDGFSKVNVLHSTLSQVPRLYLEALGFSLISFIILLVIWITKEDISSSLSLITFFLLGLFRLIPSANRILSSYNNMLFYAKSLDIIFDDLALKEEHLSNQKLDFQKNIAIEKLSFSYDRRNVLEDITLTFNKNEKIAFVGESGSGKSTLVDLIMGLHTLKDGKILIDGVLLSSENLLSWRDKIGYIPQEIYLFDGSVARNVSMEKNYDVARVESVLKQSKIFDFLNEQHDGLETNVGEGGAKLSGGQKQRIAIARALYRNPEILILDEATSALDESTEYDIMKEIYTIAKEKTLIIIAHRLSTIKGCDRVIRIQSGKVVEIENR